MECNEKKDSMNKLDITRFVKEHPLMMTGESTEIVMIDKSSYLGYFLFPFATPQGSNTWKFVTYDPNNPITINGDNIESICLCQLLPNSFIEEDK